MDGKVDDIDIQTSDMESILRRPILQWISAFRAGAFFLEILWLLPIHIALTRDNRFVPLKDSVLRADFEKALLGVWVELLTACHLVGMSLFSDLIWQTRHGIRVFCILSCLLMT
jgi:hypothetical protein